MSVWTDGRSSTCSDYMHCDFVLKGYAQLRNFWGNFVFSGDFSPKIELDGTWDYSYAKWIRDANSTDVCLCGYYSSDKDYGYNDFPNYYCYPIPNKYCSTSPINHEYYGNGWEYPVAPHGHFRYTILSGLWWAEPISVYNNNIKITIDGKKFYF